MGQHTFDASGIEPAKAVLIEKQTSTEEQPIEGTLPEDSAKATEQVAAAAEQSPPVQADADSKLYKDLQAGFTRVSQENSELRNQLSIMHERLNNISAPVQQNAPASAQQSQPDSLDAVDSEYPELKPVNQRVRELEAQLKRQNEQLQNYQRDYTEDRQLTAQQLHDNKILASHPDAFDLANTAEFTGWLHRQPVYVQNLITTGNADEIISLVSTYKATVATKPNKTEEARRVSAPNTGSAPIKTIDANKPTFTGQQIADMSDAEFIRREAEIQEAQMEGRVFS